MGLGSRMLQGLILIEICLLLVGRRMKRKERKRKEKRIG
jgi:hypothetical protein